VEIYHEARTFEELLRSILSKERGGERLLLPAQWGGGNWIFEKIKLIDG
jgi:hypothetical protein